MSIWITGDCHSDFTKLLPESFYEQAEFSGDKDENFLIICGDFGGVWYQESNTDYFRLENEKLDWLESLPFTTLFVDGNHENFDRLYSYPVKEWNGGKVHEIRPHVLHLMRGEIFTIEDKTFFAFGGASSHDIKHGILDYEDEDWREQARSLEEQGKFLYRIKGLTWWEQELPTEEEMQNGEDNLKKHNNKVDFIITHSPSAGIIAHLGRGLYEQDILTVYLEDIKSNVEYQHYFMGHMHIDRAINANDVVLYDQIVRVN